MTCFYTPTCLKAMFTKNGGLDIYNQQHVISGHVFKFASDHIRCLKSKVHAIKCTLKTTSHLNPE
jgi:hypothetical protein